MTPLPISQSAHRERGTLIRQGVGRRVRGEWQPGPETREDVWLIQAPASAGAVRAIQPEGARIQDWRRFWVDPPAKPLRVGAHQTDSDVVEFRGLRYRIRSIQDYAPDFVEAIAVRVDAQDD